MTARVSKGGLQIAAPLHDLIENQVLAGTAVRPGDFWAGLEKAVAELGPRTKDLLARRDELQIKLDQWHRENDVRTNPEGYRAFLKEIGYLVEEGEAFSIGTENVDEEIASIAGAQLVVPVMNARFALNAANARWGSLYDALYGTNAISGEGELAKGTGYNEKRGEAVIRRAAEFLDEAAPLLAGRHGDVTAYTIDSSSGPATLSMTLGSGETTSLRDVAQFVGFSVDGERQSILLKNNGLHVEVQIDRDHPIGKSSAAGVKDIVLESALSTIQDCEDSVAAVDAEDKCVVYSNWLGLMKGI